LQAILRLVRWWRFGSPASRLLQEMGMVGLGKYSGAGSGNASFAQTEKPDTYRARLEWFSWAEARADYLPAQATAILRGFTASVLGSETRSTPSFNSAWILSTSSVLSWVRASSKGASADSR